jgi:ABC-type ATPase involved in cell division
MALHKILEHHGFLWVKSKPGAGKSTMMKYALAHARKEMAGSVIILRNRLWECVKNKLSAWVVAYVTAWSA